MDLFKGIAPLNGEVVRSEVKDHSSVRISGTVELTKGNLTQRYNFWADSYASRYKGYYECSDWDWEVEYEKLTIGEIPVDNIYDFKKGLRANGLTSLADSFEIDEDTIKDAVFKSIDEMKRVSTFFGKGMKCFNALPQDEKHKICVDFVIEHFDTIGDSAKRQFGIEYDAETQTAPSLEQLTEYRSKL